jgi:hypothetical protein
VGFAQAGFCEKQILRPAYPMNADVFAGSQITPRTRTCPWGPRQRDDKRGSEDELSGIGEFVGSGRDW